MHNTVNERHLPAGKRRKRRFEVKCQSQDYEVWWEAGAGALSLADTRVLKPAAWSRPVRVPHNHTSRFMRQFLQVELRFILPMEIVGEVDV